MLASLTASFRGITSAPGPGCIGGAFPIGLNGSAASVLLRSALPGLGVRTTDAGPLSLRRRGGCRASSIASRSKAQGPTNASGHIPPWGTITTQDKLSFA